MNLGGPVNVGGTVGAAEVIEPKTKKMKSLIEFDGKYYRQDKRVNDTIYMKCHSCKVATAILRDGQVQLGQIPHTDECQVNMNQYAAREFTQKAKQKFAASSSVTTQQAHQQATEEFIQEHGDDYNFNVILPTLRSSLYLARAKRIPPIPHTYFDIPLGDLFPEQFTHTLNDPDEQFLVVNEVFHNDQRIMAFSTRSDIVRLASAEEVFMDGTFKVTPQPFQQLFTLNTMLGPYEERSALIPRMYFLLPGKTEAVYSEMFDLVLSCIEAVYENFNEGDGQAHWQRFACDFESGLIAAVQHAEFDPQHHIQLEGCHFHFCSAVYRRIVAVGPNSLHDDYHDQNNTTFKRFVQMLFALPFLPVDRVAPCLQQLLLHDIPVHLLNTARFNSFIEYFANEWVYNETKVQMVNVYARFGRRRTNNNIEGWHNKLRTQLYEHPNLWVFIERLQAVQSESKPQEQNILQHPNAAVRLRSPGQRAKEENLRAWHNMMFDPPGGAGPHFLTDRLYVHQIAHVMNVFT